MDILCSFSVGSLLVFFPISSFRWLHDQSAGQVFMSDTLWRCSSHLTIISDFKSCILIIVFKWNYQTETPQRVPCRREEGTYKEKKQKKDRLIVIQWEDDSGVNVFPAENDWRNKSFLCSPPPLPPHSLSCQTPACHFCFVWLPWDAWKTWYTH